MSRYALKFSKEGTMRYISHLDLFRLFKRSFKRSGIRLQHSQGFNPHPKMSFAQPLSLGYTSSCEYLEFETREPYGAEEIMDKLNSVLPEGVSVLSCEELPAAGKSLAALTEYASYEVRFPLDNRFVAPSVESDRTCVDSEPDITVLTERFLARDRIMITKHQKKSGKELEVDIKPMIAEFSGQVDNKIITLTMKLAAGSTSNLSPEAVLDAFCGFAGISRAAESEGEIKRTGLYFRDPSFVDTGKTSR